MKNISNRSGSHVCYNCHYYCDEDTFCEFFNGGVADPEQDSCDCFIMDYYKDLEIDIREKVV